MTIRVTLLNSDELVWRGLHSMLASVSDEWRLVRVKDRASAGVDVALLETSRTGTDAAMLDRALADPHIDKVAVWTWNHHPGLAPSVLARGAAGYLAKSLSSAELARALRDIHAGRAVLAPRAASAGGELDQVEAQGLTRRERETLVLIASGLSNDEIGGSMGLTANSVKSHIKSAYRKIGASSRSQAVLWSVSAGLHGTGPDPDGTRRAATSVAARLVTS